MQQIPLAFTTIKFYAKNFAHRLNSPAKPDNMQKSTQLGNAYLTF